MPMSLPLQSTKFVEIISSSETCLITGFVIGVILSLTLFFLFIVIKPRTRINN